MATVKQITDDLEKAKITRYVLEALPEWFEVEESRESYIKDSKGRSFFAAFSGDEVIGFLYLKPTSPHTVELAVMGVLKTSHHQGAGRALFEAAAESARKDGYSFMQVKTVEEGVYEDYDITNAFYKAVGFKELEVFPEHWDEANPCQVYIMSL